MRIFVGGLSEEELSTKRSHREKLTESFPAVEINNCHVYNHYDLFSINISD